MYGQKEAVVAQVKAFLGNTFTPYKDIALVMLSKHELERLKHVVGTMIINGTVEYSKDITKTDEVRAYARSMVMNHLKKAKELNGNQVYGSSVAQVKEQEAVQSLSKIDMALLPDDLKTFVNSLV